MKTWLTSTAVISGRVGGLLLLGLLGLSACGPSLAQRETAAAPALKALRAAQFDQARAAADRVLKEDSGNPYAHLADAISRYRKTMHDLVTDTAAVFVGAALVRGVNDRYLGFALKGADSDLAAIDASLAQAARYPDLSLELCLACWEVDWNRSGSIDDRDRRMLEIELDADGKTIPDGDPRRRPTFRFDHGDILWARAMINFQRAFLNIVMAYDFGGLNEQLPRVIRGDGALTIKLARPDAIARARGYILDAIGYADQSRLAYLAETDDDREWLPNPRQKSHPLPLPVDEMLYQTWEEILGDLRRIVAREEGLSVAELAQLGDHQWANPPQGYLDIGGMLASPKDVVINLRDVSRGARYREERMEPVLQEIFGDYYVKTMKPSPLVKRLQRMRKEVEQGQETVERKLRYLLWLN